LGYVRIFVDQGLTIMGSVRSDKNPETEGDGDCFGGNQSEFGRKLFDSWMFRLRNVRYDTQSDVLGRLDPGGPRIVESFGRKRGSVVRRLPLLGFDPIKYPRQ
jgi:hypothetical protein